MNFPEKPRFRARQNINNSDPLKAASCKLRIQHELHFTDVINRFAVFADAFHLASSYSVGLSIGRKSGVFLKNYNL